MKAIVPLKENLKKQNEELNENLSNKQKNSTFDQYNHQSRTEPTS